MAFRRARHRAALVLVAAAVLPSPGAAVIIGRDERRRTEPRPCRAPACSIGQLCFGANANANAAAGDRAAGTAGLIRLPGAAGRRVFVIAGDLVAREGRLRARPAEMRLAKHVRQWPPRRCNLHHFTVDRMEAVSLRPSGTSSGTWAGVMRDIAVLRIRDQAKELRYATVAPLAMTPENCPDGRLRLTLRHGDIPGPGVYAVQRCRLRERPAGVGAPLRALEQIAT
ncbi:MAG: hypothetical protein AAFV86_17725 [Pseudomonadota bacterium]